MDEATVSRYSVPPFSRIPERLRGKSETDESCCICGRTVAQPVRHVAIVVNGGHDWGDETSEENAGHMGCFPVGPDCHRRFALDATSGDR